jgi:nitrate reductase cytochrome c-type subunit
MKERDTRMKTMKCLIATIFLAVAASATAMAQDKGTVPEKIKDEAEEAAEAAKTFREIMKVPEDAIPETKVIAPPSVLDFPTTLDSYSRARRG